MNAFKTYSETCWILKKTKVASLNGLIRNYCIAASSTNQFGIRTKRTQTKITYKSIFNSKPINLNNNISHNFLWASTSIRNCSSTTNSIGDAQQEIHTSVPSDQTTISSTESVIKDGIEYIPPPPGQPDLPPLDLNALGEPTFESLGLGGYTPVGLVQHLIEFLHVTCDLPWMVAISTLTIVMRSLLFPLVVNAQRNAAKMANNLPQIQTIQMKITAARNSGNQFETMRLSHELMEFMKENKISPFKNMVVPLAQAPIFISVFLGLRGCANLPIESMKTSGILWFPDLTVADPFYLLSIITASTLLATIELGVDSNQAMSGQHIKYIMRAIPVIVFPLTVNFPAGILWYWVTTNIFSLVQVGFLKIPKVRTFFNIEAIQKRDPTSLPMYNKKGFVANMKETWQNNKIVKEIEDRQRVDEYAFKKAGSGPLVKTFKYDPTKPKNVINVKAKMK